MKATRLLAWLVLLATCRGEPPRTAVVLEITGEAQQNGTAITRGATLELDREISVGDGKVEIALAGVGTIRIFPHSRVTLAQSGPDVRLIVGRAWARVQKLTRPRFEIEAPNAVAGVRGTEFVVDAKEDESEVKVVEGEVEVTNKSKPERKQTLKGGQRTKIAKEREPAAPETYDAQDDQREWDKPTKTESQERDPPAKDAPAEQKGDPKDDPKEDHQGKPKKKKGKDGERNWWQRQGDAYKNMWR